MAVTYCTAAQVSAFLQAKDFGAGTTPTTTEVENIINRREDYIDHITQHAWRSVTITREYHDLPDYRHTYEYSTGYPVYLRHRDINLTAGLILDTVAGDKLEVWDGANWIDWTDTMTDSRSGDFWVEPDHGVLWIISREQYTTRAVIRITYRYGEAAVPQDIEDACIRLVASDILMFEDRGVQLPDTGSNLQIDYRGRLELLRKQAMDILQSRSEMAVPR